MKKILLFSITILTIIMTGCHITRDWVCGYNFVIYNQTGEDIVIKVGRDKPVTIESGDSEIAYQLGGICGKKTVPQDNYDSESIMNDSETTINGELVSNLIWQRSYWDFTNKMYMGTYSLSLTKEFLETLTSE